MNDLEKEYQNPTYLKEKNMFFFLLNPKTHLISDKENYIIGPKIKEYPVWIWSKDRLTVEKKEEIKLLLEEKYLKKGENPFICKKELYEEITQSFSTMDYFEMGYLQCESLKECKEVSGVFAKANYGDKIALAKLWQSFCKEVDQEEIELKECLEVVSDLLERDQFYVWRNNQGKVISMASYSVEQDVAAISHVYTKKEERNKGYCANLIYYLTKNLLEKNLHPMLYTDYHYKPSNASYKKVGYQEKGILIRFKICI